MADCSADGCQPDRPKPRLLLKSNPLSITIAAAAHAPAEFTFTVPRLGIAAFFDILAVAFVIYQLLADRPRHPRRPRSSPGSSPSSSCTRSLSARTRSPALAALVARPLLRHRHHRPFPVRNPPHPGPPRTQASLRRLSTARIHRRNPPALSSMARDRIGALIVLERDIGLRTFIESGVPLDSQTPATSSCPSSCPAPPCTMARSLSRRSASPRRHAFCRSA